MVLLKDIDCPIFIGENILEEIDIFIKNMHFSSLFILVDDNTKEHCLPLLLRHLTFSPSAMRIICIPTGEEHKNLEALATIWENLSEAYADRQSLLLNLGGGVLTDMGGFAAATYKRGISFIQIPTTLLAMADASVGGKTGIDFNRFKNQIGLFIRPLAVFICPEFLRTLSEYHFKSGVVEIFKMSLLAKEIAWQEIFQNGCKRHDFNIEYIEFALRTKLNIVASDFKETGERKILNLGHTFGHAFESLSLAQEREISHGHAVALGLICELYLSSILLAFPVSIQKEIEKTLLNIFPYFRISDEEMPLLIAYIRQDKKNSTNDVSPVLLKEIGIPDISRKLGLTDIEKAFTYYQSLENK